MPSRTTITRDVMNLYLREKKSLRDMLVKRKQRVCLTTNTWKSCQNLHYMCLTAHLIDDSWVLQKKILNYCVVPDTKGDTLGRAIEQCLLEWGLERVLTITVDNASSNNVSVQYVKKTVNQWGGAILGGQHMHLRCAAHILNLIVQEGLDDYGASIAKIRDVVRYVRGSSTRLQKLKECADQAKITSKKTVCLDVATCWNSTYFMLEAAEKYQKAFERMEMNDVGYVKEFCTGEVKKCPNESDWEFGRLFVKFLKIFHDCTLRFSGSKFVTSNQFLDRVSFVHSRLEFWNGNKLDNTLKEMAKSMKKKYDKYWGKTEALNPFLLVAILLDPRYKEPFLNVCFKLMCGDKDDAINHCKSFRMTLDSMYKEYCLMDSNDDMHMTSTNVEDDGKDVDDDVDEYALFDQLRKKKVEGRSGNAAVKRARVRVVPGWVTSWEVLTRSPKNKAVSRWGKADNIVVEEGGMLHDSSENKTKVDKYFIEACENTEQHDFDVLGWWKKNASRFKVLSLIAQNVFAIPILTVASESAFSTGGHVIDPYRSCLTPKAVQALICTQNWIQNTTSFDFDAMNEEIEALEAEILVGVGDIRLD
ncbi:hypothetical protein OSB04_027985 [Centaurea solstitialis]|uniref:Transposase n=1 Tax=Centaurea solstitialis TaxID=347529 RepID=A0AA38SGE1_9ASTR|nr:hypothetical protein OSB04_027985 [Centaurea solstitialis]